MSVIIPKDYLTIKESINKGFIDFSERHLKRLINYQLKDVNNNLVQYHSINGIKTIIIHISIFQHLKRKRSKITSKKAKCVAAISAQKIGYLSEITIKFKNDFFQQTLISIFKTYPSHRLYKFFVEGIQNKLHVHMMVQDNTETAKKKIISILNRYKIESNDVDILIRPIIDFDKFLKYIAKFGEIITHYNSLEESEFVSDGNMGYFKPYGKDYSNHKSIFNYKCSRYIKQLYQF